MPQTALPAELFVRRPTMADLEAIAALLLNCERAKYREAVSTLSSWHERVSSVWQTLGFDVKTDGWIILTSDGQSVGYITLWHPEQMPHHLVASPAVHPAYRGQGID